jgi:putative Ca2+/H+ antiporter (TMEM165/GDT1 family)
LRATFDNYIYEDKPYHFLVRVPAHHITSIKDQKVSQLIAIFTAVFIAELGDKTGAPVMNL